MALSQLDDGHGSRIAVIDVARGVAIVAMVIYHAAYNLSAAGLIAIDVRADLGWTIFARLIAGSFLFLVGVSLVLATESGIVWPSFLRRLGMIVIGAALVSIGTWWFEPDTFVFFGILHLIAVASVLGLLFLRLPSTVLVLASGFFVALPWSFRSEILDWPPLWWTGLQTVQPVSVDYVPVFPWFGVVLVGIIGGRWINENRSLVAGWRRQNAAAGLLDLAGRWSLVIYLVHQPILVGIITAAMSVIPPSEGVAYVSVMSLGGPW